MRVTIRGLRRWIVGAAVLLVAMVAGFVLYGRYRFRHIEKDLPGRLGIDIQQTANGFTYSQSSGGHTLFTLKASKEMQLKAGHVLLHNVDITTYGPPGSGRTDHIYGSDFAYDQNTGTATSQGEVNIDLAGTESPSPDSTPGANTIRVRTSGLTFEQKTGAAWTSQPVEFQLPRAAGSSVGADYNSKTGVLVLNSAVKITTSSNGQSAVIGAAHATLLRAQMQALLTGAAVAFETEEGSSDQATVWFRKDGTTEKIDAQGHVRMRTDAGATVNSATATILMDAKSQPTRADLGGGVEFASGQPGEPMRGSSREGTLLFAEMAGTDQTALRHAEFRREVQFDQQITGLAGDAAGHAERNLTAGKVDVDFAQAAAKQTEARKAVAVGSPLLTLRQMPSKGPAQTTRISGDQLVATLGSGNVLQRLDGAGHTKVVDESTDGAHDTSQGDVLHATFVEQPAPPGKKEGSKSGRVVARGASAKQRSRQAAGPPMQTALSAAIQEGHVMLTELPARKPGSPNQPQTLTGWADHAEYHAADEVLEMTGHPRISEGGSGDADAMQMSANRIDYHRNTQDATAEGDVKATYTQAQKSAGTQVQPAAGHGAVPGMGGSGPVHVIAARANMQHATNESFFYGTAGRPARMWQGSDALAAPEIEIDRNRDVLKAWGEDSGHAPVVSANFVSAMGAKQQETLVRVQSEALVYSDKQRRGDFHGSVTAEQGSQTIHADDAQVFLKPAESGAAKGNSQVERMVASGHVTITQPGRRGEGEKLVYTAADGHYVLTGTAAEPPRLWDRVHGTTTGAALLFNSQDDSVEVNGGKSSAVTETRAPR